MQGMLAQRHLHLQRLMLLLPRQRCSSRQELPGYAARVDRDSQVGLVPKVREKTSVDPFGMEGCAMIPALQSHRIIQAMSHGVD